MSRRMLIVIVVVAVMLATMVVPAAMNPLEVGDAVPVPAEVQSGLGDGSLVYPLSIQLAGGGGCGGAGCCAT